MFFYKYIYILLFLLFPFSSFSQITTIRGVVKDKITGNEISYANIGFLGTNFSVVADSIGNFKITIPNEYIKDSLAFFAVGYNLKKIPINQLMTNQIVVVDLEKKFINLKEIIVKSKKLRENKLGKHKGNSNTYMSLQDMILCCYFEPNNDFPFYIKNVKFFAEGWQNTPLLRIRIQEKDSIYNIPGEEIVHEDIILTLNKKKSGWVTLDLTKFNAFINKGGFFLSLELVSYIPSKLENDGRMISTGYFIGVSNKSENSIYSLRKTNYFKNWEEFSYSPLIGVTILQ